MHTSCAISALTRGAAEQTDACACMCQRCFKPHLHVLLLRAHQLKDTDASNSSTTSTSDSYSSKQ
eukprot:14562-Heterococcus_DN1.PRE.2